MNKKNRGYNAYFILVLLLMALLVIPSFLDNSQIEYTRGELVTDLEAGKVLYASISPGRETPTGEVEFVISGQPNKTLYVTDVSEIEELLISYGLDPEVKKVHGDLPLHTAAVDNTPLLLCDGCLGKVTGGINQTRVRLVFTQE